MSNKKNNSGIGLIVGFVLIVGGALFVYFSSMFERDEPTIVLQNNGYWNLKKPLKVNISDESGVIAYKVTLVSDEKSVDLQYEQLINAKKSISLEVEPPRTTYALKDEKIEIVIEAQDVSNWNYFRGNSAKKVVDLVIDKKRPQVSIVTNSYKISKGGSALVIFRAEDENMKELYIEGNNDKKFIPQTFHKDGYYISLLAWPIYDSSFKATVIAIDKAGNVAKAYVPLYLKDKPYRVSKINLSDKFLKGKIANLAEEFTQTQGVEGSLEQFKIINEDVRAKNEQLIHKLSSKIKDDKIEGFKISKMYPLKNAQVVAHFGDHRKYYYEGSKISESYHLGLDLASNAIATIKPQNGGEVVFSDYNGLYGNMPMISHGLGLYTLYGHCSSVKVSSGDRVAKNEVIANTGKSGYAMGDHLHFGVLVQGIEVRPQEWMDSKWIKLNITDIIKNAKKTIDRN